MTHRNEAGTPPHGEDPLGLDPHAASAPPPPEDTPLTTGDHETPPSDDDTAPGAPRRPAPEEDPLTAPAFRLRPPRPAAASDDSLSDEPEEDPLTGGLRRPSSHQEEGGTEAARTGEEEERPAAGRGFRPSAWGAGSGRSTAPFTERTPSAEDGDDPLTSGEFGGLDADQDDPLTSGSFRFRGRPAESGGDPLTSSEFGGLDADQDDPLTSGSSRFRGRSAESAGDPLTSGEFGSGSGSGSGSDQDDPLTSGPFRFQARPAESGGDPLTSGEFGSRSDQDDPLTSEAFRLRGRSAESGGDPLTSGEFGESSSASGAGGPSESPGRRERGLSGGEEDDSRRGNGSRGRYSEQRPWDEWVGGGVRWAAFHVPEDESLAAPHSWDKGSAGDEQSLNGASGAFEDDPLTSGEFGWRTTPASSDRDSLEGRRPRRSMDPEDDPLTSAEFHVPRSAELEAMRAEAAAAEKAAAEKAAEQETDEEAQAVEPAERAEPVDAGEADGDGEEPEAVEADAAETDAVDGEDAENDGPAGDREAEEAVDADGAAEAAENEDAGAVRGAEGAVEIAEVPEVPVAEPEKPEEPEERAGDTEFGRRLAGLERLVELGEGRLDEELVAEASALLERAGERMRLSGEHTVVALAGGTGSGKSSLFNAICGLELSPSGMRRPMTSSAHVCVWGHDGAGPLLDWLEIDKRYRYARAGAPGRKGAEGEESLEGLVLIDLPDHDSIRAEHRAEVDRFVGVADLLVWVVDPQKYADAALHRDYIVPFAQHAAVTLIVLNQIDRLQPAEVDDCVSDLRRLLESEGLAAPHIVTTSAVTEGGVDGLREVLAAAVAAGTARADRLGADLDKVVERFAELAEGGSVPVEIDEERAEGLVDALSAAAGVPAVAEAMESAYELRAAGYVGWPFARWAGRLRRDPLRMIRLGELRAELSDAFTGPMGAQQGEIDNALHGITDGVAADVSEPWRRSLRAVSRAGAGELPDALGGALRETLPSFEQVPRWWWLVRIWQLLLVVLALLGTLWLVLLVVYGVAGAAEPPAALLGDTGILPWVVILVSCLFGMGALTAAACRNMVALSAARHGERVKAAMRESVAELADEKVLTPVSAELSALADFRAAVSEARR